MIRTESDWKRLFPNLYEVYNNFETGVTFLKLRFDDFNKMVAITGHDLLTMNEEELKSYVLGDLKPKYNKPKTFLDL